MFVIGLDYGTDSARAVIVNAETGKTIATAVKYYPRWKEGKYCNPSINQYRQHPQDYIDVLIATVREALAECPEGTAEKVVGIAFDTTGSTPVFTDKNGVPLSMLPEFAENPNAMFVLWKDHTAVNEAAEINTLWISTIQHTKEESIPLNGIGQRLFMFCVKMKLSERLHIQSLNIANGFRHY